MIDRGVAVVLALVVAALAAPVSEASGYRWVDANGNVTWSDRPPPVGPAVAPSPAREAALIAVAPLKPAAAPPSAVGRVTTDELLAIAGLERQIGAFGAQFAEALARTSNALSPADRETARRVLRAGFATERLRRAIHAELAQHAAPAQMQAVAAWYRGPVGTRVAAAAAALGTPEGQRELAALVARQQGASPAPARLALIEQLEWLGGDADTTADLVLTARRAMALTLNAALPGELRQRPGLIERQFDEARPRLIAAMREPVLAELQFVYRDLSDDEVRQGVEFNSSAAARWFEIAVKRAFARATREAAERSARELVRAIPPERWRRATAPPEGR